MPTKECTLPSATNNGSGRTDAAGEACAVPAAPGPAGYVLPELPYSYADLEPIVDAHTMELHHDRHHRGYVDNLNKLLAPHPGWQGLAIGELLSRAGELPLDIRAGVLNNGGGHANHSLFWQSLAPAKAAAPSRELARLLTRDFGSVDRFMVAFEAAGLALFGSGWVALAADPADGMHLSITTLANQATTFAARRTVLFQCDVWEHAYYLHYENRRAEWLHAFWEIVDWPGASRRLGESAG